MKTVRTLRRFVAAAGFCGLLVGAAQANTLRWGANGDVTSMDPYAYYTTLNSGFLQNIYEPLIRYDRNFKFEPSLAVSWERISNRVWRFNLRDGVKFHNGNEFTADDVVASLLRASGPNSPYKTATSQIEDVKKVDRLAVDVVMKSDYPLLLNDLAGVFIMDKEWMEENNTLQSIDPAKGEESFAALNANGTGPYSLKSRRPDVETVLVANPNWWDKRTNNINEVIYRPIALDATRVAALLSGELDLITPSPLQDIDRIDSDEAVEVLRGQDLRVIMLGLNMGEKELNTSNIKGKNPLADAKVRQAMEVAIDRKLISSRIMKGLSRPSPSVVAPQIQGYSEALEEETQPRGADAAKALLAEAGYPDGFEIGMDCPNDNYVNTEQLCQAVASMWARAGIKASLTTQPYALYSKKMFNGKTDIYLLGWANTPQINSFAILNNVFRGEGRYNIGKYNNPALDDMVKRLASELDDQKRNALLQEALLLTKKDNYILPIQQDPLVWAKSKKLDLVQMADNKLRLWWATFK
jgi:peptide/nickel transport system substrate-binding protein